MVPFSRNLTNYRAHELPSSTFGSRLVSESAPHHVQGRHSSEEREINMTDSLYLFHSLLSEAVWIISGYFVSEYIVYVWVLQSYSILDFILDILLKLTS